MIYMIYIEIYFWKVLTLILDNSRDTEEQVNYRILVCIFGAQGVKVSHLHCLDFVGGQNNSSCLVGCQKQRNRETVISFI